jgi:hypothetical protein
MTTEVSKRHESVIQIAMLLAEKNGYSTDAWRLFEAQAEAALERMSKPQTPERRPDLAAS